MSSSTCHDFQKQPQHKSRMAKRGKESNAKRKPKLPPDAELGRRIRVAREKKEMSQVALAERLGVTRIAVSNIERAKNNPSVANLLKIVSILDDQHLRELTQSANREKDYNLVTLSALPVKGEVRAGAWLELDDTEQDCGTVPVVRNARFDHAPQFALRVNGESVNKVARSGEYLIIASWPELGRELQDGDLVVVRRQRAMTYETTVKRARKGKNGVELWPESNDPRHQHPIQLDDGSREVEVRIIGLVIGKYTDHDQLVSGS